MADKNRVGNLSESKLSATLASLEQELNELKSSAPQFINGSDVVNFVTDTGSTYDFTGTLSQDPTASSGNSRGVWLISATATHAATIYAQVLVTLYMGGAVYHGSDGFFDLTHPGPTVFRRFVTNVYDVPTTPADATNVRTWMFIVNGDTQRAISWKACVPALDNVTISIVRLS